MNSRFTFAFIFLLSALSSIHAATVTSIEPPYAMPGESVMIYGTGFSDPVEVYFNGVKDTTANANGSVNISAHVPAGATSGFVTVKVGNNQPVPSPEEFIVIGPGPYIHNFTPAGGGAGTEVTINGAHFNGTIQVRFNGILQPNFSKSSRQIILNAPNGVTTGKISVTRTNISYTNQTLFYVTPVITGFSPSFGRAGTNVTIRGTNFTGVTLVKFGNTPATQFWITNNNVIGAIVPVGAAAGILEVRNPAMNPGITTSNFIIRPTVSGFTPEFGQVGTSVTVTGANFNVGTPAVRFGKVPAASVTAVTFNSLVATVPSAAVTSQITVSNAHGTNMSSAFFYMPPRITSFSPSNAPTGGIVTIQGTNFLGASAVAFNGTPAPDFWVTNNNTIGVQVPPDAITGSIYVTTPHSTTNSGARWFFGSPIITGFNPTHGLPGTNVIILGTNFAGVSAVSFNGSPAAFFFATNGALTATVPANASTGPVSLTTPSGTTASAFPFTLDFSSDLAVTIAAPASAELGKDFTYVIVVTNRGPSAAENVMFTNTLPGNVAFKQGSSTKGTLLTSSGQSRVSMGTLNAGAKATVTIIVTAQSTGAADDLASVVSSIADPVSTNNSATASTLIYVNPVIQLQSVTMGGNQLKLSWPAVLGDFILESTTNITTGPWVEVLTEPEFIGDQKVITEQVGQDSRFYRLRQN